MTIQLPKTIATVGLSAAVCLGGVGCGQKKISECNGLVQVINTGIGALEKAPKNESDPTGVSDLKSIAETMDKLSTDVNSLQLTLKEVRKFRDDYLKMVHDIGKAERDLVLAVQERDSTKRQAAESALDAAVKQEDPLVDQINKFCQAP